MIDCDVSRAADPDSDTGPDPDSDTGPDPDPIRIQGLMTKN